MENRAHTGDESEQRFLLRGRISIGAGLLIVSFEPSSVSFVIRKPGHEKIERQQPIRDQG
jgi:hypothetical protein